MRPVNKGNAPKVYIDYGDARHDLACRIGYFCSYCEMGVNNMIEVEHVHPIDNGGIPTDWNNFLLSCKYCNTVKSARNPSRLGYLWPDIDNTDLAFEYSEINVIEPKSALLPLLKSYAQATIGLMGLDRKPGGTTEPTFADMRWRSREEVWTIAKDNYNNWIEAPLPAMARSIANCSLIGHYSIWQEIFKDIPIVTAEIDRVYSKKGLFKQLNPAGKRLIRQNANI
jgi:hypothetical protein